MDAVNLSKKVPILLLYFINHSFLEISFFLMH
jgi:hypothetical protein